MLSSIIIKNIFFWNQICVLPMSILNTLFRENKNFRLQVLQNIDLVKIHDGWYGKTITNPCAKTPLQSKLFKPIYVQLNCLFWSNGYLWPGKNCIAPLHCIGCNCVRVSDNDKKCPLPRKVCQQIKVPLGPQIPTGQSCLQITYR